jgi:hypothetical protein
MKASRRLRGVDGGIARPMKASLHIALEAKKANNRNGQLRWAQ